MSVISTIKKVLLIQCNFLIHSDNFSKAWHQKFVEESSASENEEMDVTKKKQNKSNDSDSDESDNEGKLILIL